MPKIVDHDKRRNAIARAAMSVIAERGLEATKLSDIGRLAGVTTGAITHYFADKDAVLMAALEAAYEDMFVRMSRVTSQGDYQAFDVLSVALPTSAPMRRAMAVWLAFWSRSIAEPKIASAQKGFHRRWQRQVRELVERSGGAGHGHAPDDVDDLCEGISAHVNGLIIRGLVEPRAWPKTRQHEVLVRYLDAIGL